MEWLPQRSRHIEKLVYAYSSYLLQHHGALHHKHFADRYSSDEQAGVAEAAVFTWLKSICVSPSVLEDPSLGGADFICQPPSLPTLCC